MGTRSASVAASWTPERRARASALARAKFADPAYREAHRRRSIEANGRPHRRAQSSAWMKQLNQRIRDDDNLRRKVIRGSKRARANPAFKAIQSAVQKDLFVRRPELRIQARYHMLGIVRRQRKQREANNAT